MQTDVRPMFSRHLTNGPHVHTFVIDALGRNGWDVREEHDRRVVRQARYTDWHRVERARTMFVLKAAQLAEDGWTDAAETVPV